MNDDALLLRRYIEEGSEAAFTALVHKHVDLVHSAALRRTGGDAHRAAEVAQDVFTALARQARTLAHHPVLGAWLHATTRNLAINRMLSDQRRERRHLSAMALESAEAAAPSPEWERLRPVLDAAIDELPERDRRPVVMRFLERRPFKEIGAALTVSEDAARVRTDRALEKLREALARRGITSTAAALGTTVSAYGTVGAPAGLASALAAESLAATIGGATATSAAAVVGGAQLVVIAVVSGLIAFGVGAIVARQRSAPQVQLAGNTVSANAFEALSAENQRLTARLGRLNADIERTKTASARLRAERAKATRPLIPTGRVLGAPLERYEIQEGIVNNLRQLAAAQDQYHLEHRRWPASIEELVGATNYIPRLLPMDGEDYTSLRFGPATFRVTTAGGITVGYANGPDPSFNPDAPEFRIDPPPEIARARALQRKTEEAARTATEAYRLANRGKDPREEKDLVPFFATPQEGADFVEYLEATKAAQAR